MGNNTSIITMSMALSIGAVLGACADEPTPTSPLRVTVHDGTTIAGTFDAGDQLVAFRAEMPRALLGVASVTVGGQTLTLTADADLGEVAFRGDGAILDADQHGALASLAVALEVYLGGVEDTAVMHESVLWVASQYLATAPVDLPLPSSTHQVATVDGDTASALGNNGKSCIRTGETRTAYFDGDQGNHAESWVVGSSGGVQWSGDYSCMGRCGAGCGSYDWTLDCLEHDACSRKYYSTSGAVDHNCGDEWSEASDDYASFWTRCRS